MTERIDKSVTKANWEGKIPIAFSIASSDLASINKPDDIYVLFFVFFILFFVLSEYSKKNSKWFIVAYTSHLC